MPYFRMKVIDDGKARVYRFSPFHRLVIHRDTGEIEFSRNRVKFDEVRGFWKNYRFVGKKRVYYVMILTDSMMVPITPEMDEYDVDEVISFLRDVLGDDRYGR